MIKILNLLEPITTRLDETGYKISLNKTLDNYPFVVINFPNSTLEEQREDITMEVDIWTMDTIKAIEMTSKVDKKLNGYKYIDSNIQFAIYRINRLNNLPDEDDQIKRNQLRYLVKTYFRNA